jgi:putative chitinase
MAATQQTSTLNRAALQRQLGARLYGGTMPAAASTGLAALLDVQQAQYPDLDRRQLAYVLATAYHETAHRFQPVEENLNYSAAGLVKTFPRYFPAEEASAFANRPQRIANRAYANRLGNGNEASGDGWRFRGRGFVQITGRANYRQFGIESQPELALEPDRAAAILFDGMIEGRFTAKSLSDYFDASHTDWRGARQIVNRLDRADDIAGYAQIIFAALGGGSGQPNPSFTPA